MLGERETIIKPKPLAHIYCTNCYPEIAPGIKAFCGYISKGIKPTGTYDFCIVCTDLEESHINNCKGETWT